MIAFISGILKIKLLEQKAEWWGGAGYGDTGQKVQAFSYKMNKLWGSNVRHGDYS